jgi:hypothetical protein
MRLWDTALLGRKNISVIFWGRKMIIFFSAGGRLALGWIVSYEIVPTVCWKNNNNNDEGIWNEGREKEKLGNNKEFTSN